MVSSSGSIPKSATRGSSPAAIRWTVGANTAGSVVVRASRA